ncbi:MAG: zinc metalloprotease HtpX [Phycisphaeraceae bacterium]|nr:MAG: zinc metalloprotease HtpX [Phycisphaeraceae bacterium]
MTTAGAVHTERDSLKAYPPSLTFHDLIRKNKIESQLLMWGMGLLVVLVGAAIAFSLAVYTRGGGELRDFLPSLIVGASVAAIFALIACLWSWYGGGKAILRMSGARKIEKEHDPQLFNVVDELRIAAGLPMPEVWRIDSPALNAFATGRDPQNAAVAITTGLRTQLNRDELAGVMAHEMAHVRHFDIRFAMLMATLVGLIAFACDAFLRMAFYSSMRGGGRSAPRGGGGGKGGGGAAAAILMLLALLLAVLAPLLAKLIQLSISRKREYLADAGAVELTRYPEGLASALRKLADCEKPIDKANRATAHLYIVNPMKKAAMEHHRKSNVFSTHPPIQERIDRLEALMR